MNRLNFSTERNKGSGKYEVYIRCGMYADEE